jgi:hypothetical protein
MLNIQQESFYSELEKRCQDHLQYELTVFLPTGLFVAILTILSLLAGQSRAISYNAVLFAGNKVATYGGDLGPAIDASFKSPNALWMDTAKNLYVSDSSNARVRLISASKIVATFAGISPTSILISLCCFTASHFTF